MNCKVNTFELCQRRYSRDVTRIEIFLLGLAVTVFPLWNYLSVRKIISAQIESSVAEARLLSLIEMTDGSE